MKNDIIKKTNQSIRYRIGFKLSQQILSLIFGVLLARILSPSEFGVVAIAKMIVYYANGFTNFGLNNALVQKDNINYNHVNTVFSLDLAVSSILVLITLSVANKVSLFFNNPEIAVVLRWMSLFFIITTFYSIPVVFLRRKIDFKVLSIVEFLESVLTSLLAIILALAGYSYWAIVISSLCVPVIVFVYFMFYTKWKPKILFSNNMTEIYRFGLWSFIRVQVQLIVSKIDYFVIGKYFDVRTLGIYEKSFELTDRTITGITLPVNSIFFSTFSRLKNDISSLKPIFLEAIGGVSLITYPAVFGLIAVTPNFIFSALGQAWSDTIVPVRILAFASLLRIQIGMIKSVIVSIGKYKILTILDSVCAFLFVIMCFIVIPYGIYAVCFAFFSYSLILFFCCFILIQKYIYVSVLEFLKAIFYPLIGSVLMCLFIWLLRIKFLTDSSSFLQLFSLIICGIFFYLLWGSMMFKLGLISLSITERVTSNTNFNL